MPCSPYRRGRLRQIEKWLRKEFPTPFTTRVRIQKNTKEFKDYGATYRVGNEILILISKHLRWHVAIETLLHEWAHAQVVTFDHIENEKAEHDDNWAIHYGRIYRSFYDNGGCEDSRYYTVEKKFRTKLDG